MRKTRLLIVDDDEIILRMVVNALASDLNFEVTTAKSAEEVITRFGQGERVDRLLVDWNMPGKSGIELVRTLRSDARHDGVGILMITRENSMDSVKEALACGANDYLMKPFTKDMLLGKLDLLELDHG